MPPCIVTVAAEELLPAVMTDCRPCDDDIYGMQPQRPPNHAGDKVETAPPVIVTEAAPDPVAAATMVPLRAPVVVMVPLDMVTEVRPEPVEVA